MNEIAASEIPVKATNQNNPPWRDDPELRELLQLRDNARQNHDSTVNIKRLSCRILNRHNTLKNEFFKAKAVRLNAHAINRQIAKLFAEVTYNNLQKTTPSCPPEKLNDHFTKHFNPPLPKEDEIPIELTTEIPEFVKDLQEISRQHPFNNETPSRDEVVNSLAKLKNGIASNDIQPEILKHARYSSKFIDFLMELIEQVWNEKTVPSS